MERQFFNHQFAVLISAFSVSRKLGDESQEIYWEMLKDLPADKFAAGVRSCLAGCKFFPTIAELGDASMPAIEDRRAPLPAIDHERPRIGWQEQLKREKEKQQKRLPASMAGLVATSSRE